MSDWADLVHLKTAFFQKGTLDPLKVTQGQLYENHGEFFKNRDTFPQNQQIQLC